MNIRPGKDCGRISSTVAHDGGPKSCACVDLGMLFKARTAQMA